jgi:hypothetical protein
LISFKLHDLNGTYISPHPKMGACAQKLCHCAQRRFVSVISIDVSAIRTKDVIASSKTVARQCALVSNILDGLFFKFSKKSQIGRRLKYSSINVHKRSSYLGVVPLPPFPLLRYLISVSQTAVTVAANFRNGKNKTRVDIGFLKRFNSTPVLGSS